VGFTLNDTTGRKTVNTYVAVDVACERLLAKGKAKLVAKVACMRKLLVIVNAMLRDGTAWSPALARAMRS